MRLISLGPSQPEKRSDRLNNPAIPLSSVADWMWLGGGAETDAAELVNNGNSIATFDRIHLCEDPGRERFEFSPATLLQNSNRQDFRYSTPVVLSVRAGTKP